MKRELQLQIINGAITDDLLQRAEASLTDEQKKLYEMQLLRGKKNIVLSYIIWFFFGMYQLHLVYLGILNKAHLFTLRVVALVLIYFGLGFFIVFPLWIYDAIKMPKYMNDAERMRKAKILILMIPNDKVENTNDEEFDFATPVALVESTGEEVEEIQKLESIDGEVEEIHSNDEQAINKNEEEIPEGLKVKDVE